MKTSKTATSDLPAFAVTTRSSEDTRDGGLVERRQIADSDPTPPPPEIIFFGNGPLADFTLATLKSHVNLLFHARTKADLTTVADLKTTHPSAHGILASFGVLIQQDLLDLFEPEGILNLHPSLLPLYRGASPIESAILNGDRSFSISIMKLVKAMDAGPLYHQATLAPTSADDFSLAPVETTSTPVNASLSSPEPPRPTSTSDLPKTQIYQKLAETGSLWLLEHFDHLPTPISQNDQQATFTRKFTPDDSPLDPSTHTATELLDQVRAFQDFPKSKYTFYGHECIIHEAHLASDLPGATPSSTDPHLFTTKKQLALACQPASAHPPSSHQDAPSNPHNTLSHPQNPDRYLVIDRLQPAGKKPMDARSFLNGYKK